MSDLLNDILDRIRHAGLHRSLRTVDSPQEAEIVLDGRRVINFSGNNTLGLATHRSLRAAAAAALETYGVGSGASRSISGSMEPHRRLEDAAALFVGREAALYFASGYQANVGAIPVLAAAAPAAEGRAAKGRAPQGTVILSDSLNHASLIDGIRLARAECRVFAHGDRDALRQLLEEVPAERGVMVVTESLFSMEGDRAPVREIAALKSMRPFLLYVDEAHAVGAVGPGGRGLAAGIDGVDVVLGTLGKAFGVSGAFLAGSGPAIDLLVNRCRSFIYTTAPLPAVAAAAEKALEVAGGPEGERLREKLHRNVAAFREMAAARGFHEVVAPATDGKTAATSGCPGRDHIVPIRCPGNERVNRACAALLERGIYCLGIRHPTVPRGEERLRFSLSALHDTEHLAKAAEALGSLPELKPGPQD